MSYRKCKRCDGTGTLHMQGRVEDAEVCCDGGDFICDNCDNVIDDPDEINTVGDDEHQCGGCYSVNHCEGCGDRLKYDEVTSCRECAGEY